MDLLEQEAAWLPPRLSTLSRRCTTLTSSALLIAHYQISKEMQTRGEQSFLKSARRIIAEGALYQGIRSGLVAMGGTMFVFFWSHSVVKRLLLAVAQTRVRPHRTGLSPSMDFAAGLLAGSVCSVLSEPMWMINARLMVNSDDGQRKYSGIMDCIRTVLR